MFVSGTIITIIKKKDFNECQSGCMKCPYMINEIKDLKENLNQGEENYIV